MNEGHYTNIRNYLEEQSGLLREIRDEQKRTNELLAQSLQPPLEFVRFDSGDTKPRTATKKAK